VHTVGAAVALQTFRGKYMKRKPSAALVISIVALVLAASGTAVAASKLVSGNRLIKVNSLSGNRLKSGSVTGKQIALKSLGTVPSATKATTATSAISATTATTATSATTAGSAPISTVTYVTGTGTIVADSTSPLTVTASCPSGTTVIGGGGSVTNEGYDYLNDSYPAGKTGWTADFYGTEGGGATVTAICAPAAVTSP
jgi:hypothetical protein